MVILNSWYDHSRTSARYWIWFCCSFVSSDSIFFLTFSITYKFLLKPGTIYWVIVTDINRPLVRGFVLIWLRVWVSLIFDITVDIWGFSFLYFSCLFISCFLWFSLETPQRETETSSSFSLILCYYTEALLLSTWGVRGGDAFSSCMVRSLCFSEPVPHTSVGCSQRMTKQGRDEAGPFLGRGGLL